MILNQEFDLIISCDFTQPNREILGKNSIDDKMCLIILYV